MQNSSLCEDKKVVNFLRLFFSITCKALQYIKHPQNITSVLTFNKYTKHGHKLRFTNCLSI